MSTARSTTTALAALIVTTACAHAQPAPMPPIAPRAPMVWSTGGSFATRAYLGITPNYSSGAGDTLGILIDDIESGYAADKAGIKRGARIVSIDGLDLRVDPKDLGDYAGESLPGSRLRRALSRKEPGDTVTVVVLNDGRKETKQLVLSESPFGSTVRARTNSRRILGLSFSQRGSMRDTAGLLVLSVNSGGPADKAGIVEGDRIVSIDGTDLRVPSADAGESEGVNARVSRLRRVLDAGRDSQSVKLEVVSEGRRRTVNVTPVRESGFVFAMGDLSDLANNIRGQVRDNVTLRQLRDWSDEDNDARQARSEAQRELRESQREMAREQRERSRELAEEQRDRMRELRERTRELARDRNGWDYDRGSWSSDDVSRGTFRGRTDGATLTIGGLSLATVDRDFAQQFGKGSEDGALVVRTRGRWDPLKAGDVLLTIDGRPVRVGDSLDVSFDRRKDQRLEILRNGRKETVTLEGVK